jgi:hypothetical protein
VTYGHTLASRGENRKRNARPSFAAGAGMRLSTSMRAVWLRVIPAGTGRTNSTTPKASATSASVVSRVKTVFRPSHVRT